MPFQIVPSLREHGAPIALATLLRAQGVSHPTMWRALRAAGADVASWRVGRTLWVAATRPPGRIPVRQVTEEGTVVSLADLRPLWDGQWLWDDWQGRPRVFVGLPPEIAFLHPEGFLGRTLAHRIAPLEGVADNPLYWSDWDVVRVLSEYGEDVPGDLLIGERAYERWWHLAPTPIPEDTHIAYLEERARAVMAGEVPGSSAGGEQPKFVGMLRLPPGRAQSVVVKFSPPRGTPIAERWADLLAAEEIALSLWRDAGFPAAVSHVVDGPARRFLVSWRFDRVGATGRRGVLSLGALDDEYFGKRAMPWSAAASRLEASGMLSSADAHVMRLADAFGILIANTDRHYGNLSLYRPTAPGDPFRLAPLYDMTPMAYAPQRDELRPDTVILSEVLPGLDVAERHRVTHLAWAFWDRCAHSPFVSPTFQALAAHHARELQDRLAPSDDASPLEGPSAPRA